MYFRESAERSAPSEANSGAILLNGWLMLDEPRNERHTRQIETITPAQVGR
jgi:hypothetical protein